MCGSDLRCFYLSSVENPNVVIPSSDVHCTNIYKSAIFFFFSFIDSQIRTNKLRLLCMPIAVFSVCTSTWSFTNNSISYIQIRWKLGHSAMLKGISNELIAHKHLFWLAKLALVYWQVPIPIGCLLLLFITPRYFPSSSSSLLFSRSRLPHFVHHLFKFVTDQCK